jgi:hypothetical protein
MKEKKMRPRASPFIPAEGGRVVRLVDIRTVSPFGAGSRGGCTQVQLHKTKKVLARSHNTWVAPNAKSVWKSDVVFFLATIPVELSNTRYFCVCTAMRSWHPARGPGFAARRADAGFGALLALRTCRVVRRRVSRARVRTRAPGGSARGQKNLCGAAEAWGGGVVRGWSRWGRRRRRNHGRRTRRGAGLHRRSSPRRLRLSACFVRVTRSPDPRESTVGADARRAKERETRERPD